MVLSGRGVKFDKLIDNKTPQPTNYHAPLTDQVDESDTKIEKIYATTQIPNVAKVRFATQPVPATYNHAASSPTTLQ